MRNVFLSGVLFLVFMGLLFGLWLLVFQKFSYQPMTKDAAQEEVETLEFKDS